MNAREHPVFTELSRVKQYFDKIKAIESPPERALIMDKSAAARFIKAGLVSSLLLQASVIDIIQVGNEKYDLERAEREAKERVKMLMRSGTRNRPMKKRKIDATAQVAESASEFRSNGSDSDTDTGASSSSGSSGGSGSGHQAVAHSSSDTARKNKRKTAAKANSDLLEISSPRNLSMGNTGTASKKPDTSSEGMKSPSIHELNKKQRKVARRVARADNDR